MAVAIAESECNSQSFTYGNSYTNPHPSFYSNAARLDQLCLGNKWHCGSGFDQL